MVFWQTPSPIPPGSVVLDGKRIEIQSPSRKLDDKRHGPFEIIEQIGDASYRLLPPCWKIHDVFHVLKLVPFKPRYFITPQPPPLVADNASQKFSLTNLYAINYLYRLSRWRLHRRCTLDFSTPFVQVTWFCRNPSFLFVLFCLTLYFTYIYISFTYTFILPIYFFWGG